MICSLINLSSQLQTSRQWQLAFWNMNSNPATCSLGLEENGVGFSSQLRPPVSDAFRKSLKNLVNAGQWHWWVCKLVLFWTAASICLPQHTAILSLWIPSTKIWPQHKDIWKGIYVSIHCNGKIQKAIYMLISKGVLNYGTTCIKHAGKPSSH